MLGLGLAALGRPAYINVGRSELPPSRSVDDMRAASWAVLDAAYEAGVRWVDVARSYGLAEEFLAGWLDSRAPREQAGGVWTERAAEAGSEATRRAAQGGKTPPPRACEPASGTSQTSTVTVSSKWGYAYVGGWRLDAAVHEEKSHTLDRFRTQWAESTALLGDRLALYQVHSLTPDSPLFDDLALQDALAALPVRVGFSTSGPAQADVVRRALALERHGVRVFSAVQSTWNVLEPSVGPALAEAHTDGALVLVKEAMANGRLALDPPEPVAALARSLDVGPDAVALAAALAQPWVDVVLSGAAGTHQLAGNLAALSVGEVDLPDLAEPPAGYWAHRSSLAWA